MGTATGWGREGISVQCGQFQFCKMERAIGWTVGMAAQREWIQALNCTYTYSKDGKLCIMCILTHSLKALKEETPSRASQDYEHKGLRDLDSYPPRAGTPGPGSPLQAQ